MRRALIGAALAALLALPASSVAGREAPSDGTLSVQRGRGAVALNVRGTIVGRVARGTIRITDPSAFDGPGFQMWGCERSRDESAVTRNPDDERRLCTGRDLRFRATRGRYVVLLRGVGIWLSAVGRGPVVLDGRGDGDEGVRDGVYSFNGEPFQSLPDFAEEFFLSAPSME